MRLTWGPEGSHSRATGTWFQIFPTSSISDRSSTSLPGAISQADVTCAAREPPYTSPFYLLQALPQIFGRPGSKASQVYQQSLLQSAFHLSRELLICVCISASASLDFNHCPDVALQEVRETMLRLQRSALCKCLTVSYPCAGTKG